MLTFPRCCFHTCFAQPLTAEQMPATLGDPLRAQGIELGNRSESGSCTPEVKRVTAYVPSACSVLHVLLCRDRSDPKAAAKGKPP